MVCILLLALLLRLIHLNQSLWLDEAIQAWAVKSFSFPKLLTVFSPTDVHPPLSYLINKIFSSFFGYSEIALRSPSVIFGVMAVYFIYKIALILKIKPAYLPALLLSTSGLHLYYSQEARMYSLTVMLVSASIYYLLQSIKNQKSLYLYFIFSLASFYSHYLAFTILPVNLLMVYLIKPQKIKALIKTQIFIFAAYLPWLPILFNQLKAGIKASATVWGGVVGGLSFKNLLLIPIKFTIGRISVENNYLFALYLILPMMLITYLFFIFIKNRNQNKPAFKTLFYWLLMPLIFAGLVSFKLPILSYTRLIFILPAFYLSLSLAISSFSKKCRLKISLILIFINLITSFIYLFNPQFHREDWKSLARVLKEENQNSYPVAVIAAVKAPLDYYYSGNLIDFPFLKDSQYLIYHPEIWVIPYAQPIFYPEFDYQSLLISSGFKPEFKQYFRGDLTLIKYIK